LSRLSKQINTVKICGEIMMLLRLFESENDKKSWQMEKTWKEICKKNAYFEIETNCQEVMKFPDLDELLDRDWDFRVWTLMSRQNHSRNFDLNWDLKLFENIKIFLTV
jgi:hypothetical protein